MSYTRTEENYLKAIYTLYSHFGKEVATNTLAERLDTKASSATDMMKKLASKKLVNYEKYKGVSLTKNGEDIALGIIRNHRIWEVFLVEKLGYKWDEVHEIAEQLEHIKSDQLVDRLDSFLGNPKYDPHGDPIPSKKGILPKRKKAQILSELEVNATGKIVGVKNTTNEFLQYLEETNLTIGQQITLVKEFDFDKSKVLQIGQNTVTISKKVASQLIIEKK